ncbi:uncharacterized protein LOC131014236 isoform X4 [Salvia miltiorrhiza]|uniref:uncharacterized protein LOC131014236 isoform X4 n=1 Tax=Salvia miltiorrhiza TaxID=226208 RepID=UPI0025AD0937|nr:uncharacterized protein LOC131014236 isoform X4 [Salvia miltiorrhiza]XP_057798120.1 uncharacterized protein LOC131014236 isoform X4 [Salvia miltiorrhiza]
MSKKIPELEPSTSRKRPRHEEAEPQTEKDVENSPSLSLEDNFTFSDTLMALRMMRAQFPHIQKSQLYSSIKNRTEVDREIESLKRERVVRIFKLNTGQDDHAIMFTDDYINQIEHVVRRMEEKNTNNLVVFEWFKTHVIQSKLDTSIGHQELIRQLIDQNMYWFSIPNIGSVLKGLSQGRKELLSLLNRRKYKEMMMASLEMKRLRFSPLDMRFHLRDLIGSGQLKISQTPSGLIVRVAKD